MEFKELACACQGWYKFHIVPVRKAKFTVTNYTKQFITVIKIIAAFRLEFRSFRLNIGRDGVTWVMLFVIVSHFRRIRSTAKNDY
jgi:hypothetical protein